ncbi:MAG: Sulfate transport system permease protein CysW, partial [uncultured Gemmatimonadaceae bacterium]
APAGLPPRDAAGPALRHRLRRRALHRPRHRRVRGGERRERQDRRRDRDAHAARREALPELRPGRRLRGVGPAGRHRPGDAAGHDPHPAPQGGHM